MFWKSNTVKIVSLLIVVVFAVFVVLALQRNHGNTVTIHGEKLSVEIAQSRQAMAKGLSDRDLLPEYSGMLFVYQYPLIPSFWMKDMHFPIDIIWIGQDWKVADITENISLDSFPHIFSPKVLVQYVLEVNALWAKNHAISIGDTVTLR